MSQMLIPNPLFTNHYGQSGAGLSPRLWSKIGAHGAAPDGSQGFFLSDDFLAFGQTVAVSSNVACYASAAGQYKSFEDTSTTLAQLATATGGVISFGLDATDNHEVSLCQGGAGTAAAASVLGALSYDTAANRKLTIFEARLRVSSVADDVSSLFIGLMEENGAVHNAKVDDTGATIDNDFIGFESVHTNSGTTGTNASLNFVYKKDGQTKQTVITGAQTLVANTWYKVGFVYDPAAPDSRKITAYIDNEEKTSAYVTATNMDAATFPDGEEMGFTAIAKSGAATASTFDIDWWAFYQER